MATPQAIELAKTLPPRLLRFFQRYPPPQLFPKITSQIVSAPPENPETTSTTSPTDANVPAIETSSSEAIVTSPTDLPFPNPFQPTKNFTTGRWHGPVYGLRKQADLVKLASAHGVVDLLPWTIKKPGEKEARRIERGLTVKGTGEGQRVKGKLWERTLKGRLEMRRQAMLDMPRLIQEWKQVCEHLKETWLRTCADNSAERSRPWLEEVAEWKGEEIGVTKLVGQMHLFVSLCCVYLCVWMIEHIAAAFRQVNILLCIISTGRDACMKQEGAERCNNIYPLIICNVLVVSLNGGYPSISSSPAQLQSFAA